MTEKYYLDTSIWMDMYEDRKGYCGEPIGYYAFRLIAIIKNSKSRLIISDILIKELLNNYSFEQINSMLKPFEKFIDHINSTKYQIEEAESISKQRNLPKGDVLHAILSRDNNLILISRDKHFRQLQDVSKYYKPEDVI
jgi:predicted nucleic acid-binding protein